MQRALLPCMYGQHGHKLHRTAVCIFNQASALLKLDLLCLPLLCLQSSLQRHVSSRFLHAARRHLAGSPLKQAPNPCRHSSHEESPLHPRSVSLEGDLISPAARRADMFVVSPVAGQRLAMNVLTHLLFVKDGLFVADSSAGIRVYLRPQASSRQSSPSRAPSAEPPPAKPAVNSHPLEHKADSPSGSPGPVPASASGGGTSGATQQRSGVAARQSPSGPQSLPSAAPGRAQQPPASPYSTQAAQAGVARQTSSRSMGTKSSMAGQNSGGMARQTSGGLQRQGSRQGSIATGTASPCNT